MKEVEGVDLNDLVSEVSEKILVERRSSAAGLIKH